MALTKENIEDKIEIVDCGDWKVIQVRTATVIKDDGLEVTRTFHRKVVQPTDTISNESAEVQGIAALIFTDSAKTAFTEAQAAGPVTE
tara:strand:- start:121 stop:384 length:264 start_codon:yes stop_codon:yes gene_type:complete